MTKPSKPFVKYDNYHKDTPARRRIRDVIFAVVCGPFLLVALVLLGLAVGVRWLWRWWCGDRQINIYK